MKSTLVLLAAAAGVGQATAALFGAVGVDAAVHLDLGFLAASPYTCPGNIENQCSAKQEAGWDWSDLAVGKVDVYRGFDFDGWTCEDSLSKRGKLRGRNSGLDKVIAGSCGPDVATAPSISCGAGAAVDAFSIGSMHVSVEFDTRMEFHYEMADGHVCKTSQDCYKAGTTVTNTQCGGAKKVSFVYPKQPDQAKDSCNIAIHNINWDCSKNKPGPFTSIGQQTTSAKQTAPGQSAPGQQSTPVQGAPGQQTTPVLSAPGQQTTPGKPTPILSTLVQQTTPGIPTVILSAPIQQTTASNQTAPVQTAPVPVTVSRATTIVTTYQTTSTVFATSVHTITSCAPEITNCPARASGGTAVVTVTIPVSTTICPVTETMTMTGPAPVGGAPGTSQRTKPSTILLGGGQGSSAPAAPQPTGCPSVVPQCLNTFLHLTKGCKNNMDAACYCSSKDFVDSVFSCLYAHGQTGNVIAVAVSYFQGICAPMIPQNPVIATGAASITSIITVTGTPYVTAVPHTAITVTTTVTEPCVTRGTTIPGSSTTKVISTAVTVPQITLTMGYTATGTPAPTTPAYSPPAQSLGTSVVIVAPSYSVPANSPSTSTLVIVPPAYSDSAPSPVYSSIVPTPAIPPPALFNGTGGGLAPNATGPFPVIAGAGRTGAGLGLVLAAVAAAVAL
ncbi:Uncharacterized protein TCAP_01089 [Tolypocladium capitatum]|uniref:CFEM domain-containing protein n=1 Tax=Tolypocladium capitatum TaxID=45235 RepID=A0A2K3QN76_9HYPO|nr:Uncharacterized protein TCAP_01089 [Tolypocladium capitatum]